MSFSLASWGRPPTKSLRGSKAAPDPSTSGDSGGGGGGAGEQNVVVEDSEPFPKGAVVDEGSGGADEEEAAGQEAACGGGGAVEEAGGGGVSEAFDPGEGEMAAVAAVEAFGNAAYMLLTVSLATPVVVGGGSSESININTFHFVHIKTDC